jgi:hypothetical protein
MNYFPLKSLKLSVWEFYYRTTRRRNGTADYRVDTVFLFQETFGTTISNPVSAFES